MKEGNFFLCCAGPVDHLYPHADMSPSSAGSAPCPPPAAPALAPSAPPPPPPPPPPSTRALFAAAAAAAAQPTMEGCMPAHRASQQASAHTAQGTACSSQKWLPQQLHGGWQIPHRGEPHAWQRGKRPPQASLSQWGSWMPQGPKITPCAPHSIRPQPSQ